LESITPRTWVATRFAAASSPSGSGMRMITSGRAVAPGSAAPRLSWIVASPWPRPLIWSRRSSSGGASLKATRIDWPPMKSTPRFSPRTATSAIDAITSSVEMARATFRHFMNWMFVLSGTSFSRRIRRTDQSNRERE
jgi:hypothetical protein